MPTKHGQDQDEGEGTTAAKATEEKNCYREGGFAKKDVTPICKGSEEVDIRNSEVL